jgi:hypothetical protein
MQNSFRWCSSWLLLPCLVALALLAAKTARADFIVTLTEQGGNVVATGSGQIDLTGLRLRLYPFSIGIAMATIIPDDGSIINGPVSSSPYDAYEGAIGTPFLGVGRGTFASTGSGDIVGVEGGSFILVPHGYVSDSPLSDTATYDNATFASLGVGLGDWEWNWGTGANQKFILAVTPVPEPSSLGILAALLAFAGIIGLRKRKSVVTG